MANYYTQFSLIVPNLTDEEIAFFDRDHVEELVDDDYVGFSWSILREDGRRDLWIGADESGTPEHVVSLLQPFLRAFRPDDYIAFEWANTCSKPRPDGFGGGAVFFTATEDHWCVTARWVGDMIEKYVPNAK